MPIQIQAYFIGALKDNANILAVQPLHPAILLIRVGPLLQSQERPDSTPSESAFLASGQDPSPRSFSTTPTASGPVEQA